MLYINGGTSFPFTTVRSVRTPCVGTPLASVAGDVGVVSVVCCVVVCCGSVTFTAAETAGSEYCSSKASYTAQLFTLILLFPAETAVNVSVMAADVSRPFNCSIWIVPPVSFAPLPETNLSTD